jgi:hypothetical protein
LFKDINPFWKDVTEAWNIFNNTEETKDPRTQTIFHNNNIKIDGKPVSQSGMKRELNILILLLLLLSSLYILSVLRITAVFISRHLGPVIPTSAILKKGSPQQVTHLPPVWDILLVQGTRNLGITSHSKDEEIEVK